MAGPDLVKCGDCLHYVATINPDTGRAMPSRNGFCTFQVEWPAMPSCFSSDRPYRGQVWRERKSKCQTFQATAKAKRAAAKVQVQLEVGI